MNDESFMEFLCHLWNCCFVVVQDGTEIYVHYMFMTPVWRSWMKHYVFKCNICIKDLKSFQNGCNMVLKPCVTLSSAFTFLEFFKTLYICFNAAGIRLWLHTYWILQMMQNISLNSSTRISTGNGLTELINTHIARPWQRVLAFWDSCKRSSLR